MYTKELIIKFLRFKIIKNMLLNLKKNKQSDYCKNRAVIYHNPFFLSRFYLKIRFFIKLVNF